MPLTYTLLSALSSLIHTFTSSSTPAAYPNYAPGALDDLSYDLSTFLQNAYAPTLLHAPQLRILPGRGVGWKVQLDCVVLSDSGNVHDTLCAAARCALWNVRVPRTRAVGTSTFQSAAAKAQANANGMLGVMTPEQAGYGLKNTLVSETGGKMKGKAGGSAAAEFELEDSWDEGAPIEGRDRLPVCVTLNVVRVCINFSTSVWLNRSFQ